MNFYTTDLFSDLLSLFFFVFFGEGSFLGALKRFRPYFVEIYSGLVVFDSYFISHGIFFSDVCYLIEI
jgi:hypothetical protein